MTDEFWTYSIDGDEERDSEYETCEECIEKMDEEYANFIQENEWDLVNGQSFSTDAEIIRFRYNDDGERITLYTKAVEVNYTHYHGDLAEHGTY